MIKQNIKKSTFVALLCVICHATTILAAPVVNSVSGDVTLIITGNDFTEHVDYSPANSKTIARGWNDFENGIILIDDWSYGLGGAYQENWNIRSGSMNRSGSSYFAARNYVNSRLGGLLLNQNFDMNEWYWTFYIQISDTCPTGGAQGKISRLYGDNGNMYFAPYGGNGEIFGFFEVIGASQWGSPDELGTNSWHRVEIFMSQSPQETSVWIDGKHQWTRNDWPASNFNGGGHSWEIGNMVSTVQNTCYHRYDDVYFDHTRARVEIGDAAIWENCQTREIQVPKEWSSSTITVQANYGSFNIGDVAYLYVVDSEGNVSNNGQGQEMIVGEGGTGGADNGPVVAFTSPTTGSSYSVEITGDQEVITVSGTASDDNSVQSVTYSTDSGQNGNASTGDGFDTWSLPVTVNKNETVVTTITVTDDADQSTSKTMTITGTSPVGWDANVQTGDTTWTDSGVTYCVRLLVEGDSVVDSASQVVLGFQGHSSGDYIIRNVSIAERDTAGSEGDVIDDTWSQVTFDNAAWNNSVTVDSGAEKFSDPASIQLKTGTDYYVTLKIDSPSVYLDPPTGYRELYFSSADHTSDIDWSGNGHSVTQDYHALSKIYVYSSEIGAPDGFSLDSN